MNQSEMPLTFYANPLSIQGGILDEFQSRLKLSSGVPITDPNNVFCFLLEQFSTTTANVANTTCNNLDILYPKRAQTVEDLYRHMSDFDYLNLFSSPATCTLNLTLDRNYLVRNALPFLDSKGEATDFNAVIIPQDSIFTVAQYKFGLHYPIIIKINKQTSTISISYDTDINNPLHQLTLNTVENRTTYLQGMELISISIPVYQFIKTTTVEDAIQATGFVKVCDYTDLFYAMRIYNWKDTNNDGVFKWTEIEQSLSDDIYDPTVLTAQLTVLSDVNKIRVIIPQVYFTNNLVGSKLKMEIYTTLGAIDVDISTVDVANISANFIALTPDEIKYSNLLKKLETIAVTPISTKIVGGTKGYSFETLRDHIINNTFDKGVLITVNDLAKHFSDIGFSVQKYQDGITNRIYLCYKAITDNAGANISALSVPVVFDDATLNSSSTIKNNADGTYTVLPSTLYRYDDVMNVSRVVSDTDVVAINGYATTDLINTMNNVRNADGTLTASCPLAGTYLVSPFHLWIDTNSRYPLAYSYNLNKPYIKNISFVAANSRISTQISAYNATIAHLNNGTAGYDILVSITKSEDLSSVLPNSNSLENIRLLVNTIDMTGRRIWTKAVYVGESNGKSVFKIHIDTNYQISANHALVTVNNLNLTPFVDADENYVHSIPLDLVDADSADGYDHSLELLFLVNQNTLVPSGNTNRTIAAVLADLGVKPFETPLKDLKPSDPSYDDFIPVNQQKLEVSLGQLVTQTFNRVDVLYTAQEYEKWKNTEFAVYPRDIYAVDPITKVFAYDIVDTHVVLTKTHAQGELMTTPFLTVNGLSSSAINAFYQLQINEESSTVITVADDSERFALTTPVNGNTIKVLATGMTYNVVDASNLSSEVGYSRIYLKSALPMVDNVWKPIKITGSFTNSDLINHKLSIRHNYGSINIPGLLHDEANGELLPLAIDYATNLITVDFTGTTITGTCTYEFSYGSMYLEIVSLLPLATELAIEVATFADLTNLATDTLFAWVIDDFDDSSVASISHVDLGTGGAMYYYNTSTQRWIKWVTATSRAIVNSWITTNHAVYSDLLIGVNQITAASTVATFELLPSDDREYSFIWVSHLATDADTSIPILTDDETILGTGGALYKYDTENSVWVKQIEANALTTAKSWLTDHMFIGYAYAAYESSSAVLPSYINILSFNTALSWEQVGVWPWECQTPWRKLDITLDVRTVVDCTYVNDVGILVSLNQNNNPLIIHSYGDPILNASNQPIVTQDRQLVFHIDMLQFDAKLKYSRQQAHLTYLSSLNSLLMTYFAAVTASEGQLIENTKIYFRPIRSVGTGVFQRDNVSTIDLSLEFTMALRLYVYPFVIQDAQLTSLVRTGILNLIDKHIQSGTISCTAIVNDILSTMSDNIKFVDVLGINGIPSLQTLISLETDTCPHLKQLLVQDADGSIVVSRGLSLEFVAVN